MYGAAHKRASRGAGWTRWPSLRLVQQLTLFPAKRRGRGVVVSGKSLSSRGSRFSSMPWHEVMVSRSTRSLSREWQSSSRW